MLGPLDFIILQEDDVLDIGDYHLKVFSTPGHTQGIFVYMNLIKAVLFWGPFVK